MKAYKERPAWIVGRSFFCYLILATPYYIYNKYIQ